MSRERKQNLGFLSFFFLAWHFCLIWVSILLPLSPFPSISRVSCTYQGLPYKVHRKSQKTKGITVSFSLLSIFFKTWNHMGLKKVARFILRFESLLWHLSPVWLILLTFSLWLLWCLLMDYWRKQVAEAHLWTVCSWGHIPPFPRFLCAMMQTALVLDTGAGINQKYSCSLKGREKKRKQRVRKETARDLVSIGGVHLPITETNFQIMF